eukprot:1337622-Lingulodinium_polyedra.AAC.1
MRSFAVFLTRTLLTNRSLTFGGQFALPSSKLMTVSWRSLARCSMLTRLLATVTKTAGGCTTYVFAMCP